MPAVVISVVYQSSGGHTRRMAEAVERGCRSLEGIDVRLLEIAGADVKEGRWNNDSILARLDASDAIAFGCATYMGSGSAIFKAFLERAFDKWTEQAWKDKFACGFTNSASHSGDKLSTLTQRAIFSAQMCMIWVGVGDGPGNNWSGGSVDDNNRLGELAGGDGSVECGPGTGTCSISRRHSDGRTARKAPGGSYGAVARTPQLCHRAGQAGLSVMRHSDRAGCCCLWPRSFEPAFSWISVIRGPDKPRTQDSH
jgi:NAD(P)H dehydrogenase (quinone)